MVGRNVRTRRILYYRWNCHRHPMHSRDQLRPHDAILGIPLSKLPNEIRGIYCKTLSGPLWPVVIKISGLNVSLRVPPCFPHHSFPSLQIIPTPPPRPPFSDTNPSRGTAVSLVHGFPKIHLWIFFAFTPLTFSSRN
jgi:hypothetical protein